jgi:hypothetical protein
MPKQPVILAFFDEATNAISYLAADSTMKKAVVIDPVLDYDHTVGTLIPSPSRPFEGGRRGKLPDRMGTGNPRPCRPSLACTVHQGPNGRQDLDR